LAYIGGDGNVYLTTASGKLTIPLTDDATVAPEGQGRSYHRLSWSPEGWLAFAAVDRIGNHAQSQLYVAQSPQHADRALQLVAENDQHFVIYMYWSPATCPDQPECRHLAYLVEEEQGVGLHLLDIRPAQIDQQRPGDGVVDATMDTDPMHVGRPFYFSWAPSGLYLLSHTGGARPQNPLARLVVYNVTHRDLQTLPTPPGAFQAPAWSPDGSGWLVTTPAGEASGASRLQLFDAASHRPTLLVDEGLTGDVSFAWSPDGQRIAYVRKSRPTDDYYGPIQLYDRSTGTSTRLTAPPLRILGFFWAPGGERLAYLTQLDLPDATWMQWRVLHLTPPGTGAGPSVRQDRGFAAFHPSPLMRFVIHSFNQYAQSHRFWSPDGRYLVYAERDRTLTDRVWLVDTRNLKDRKPLPVAAGSLAFWSWK
jgi:dipeptidyl aminopeptidase/acylaminoacyl peptidase